MILTVIAGITCVHYGSVTHFTWANMLPVWNWDTVNFWSQIAFAFTGLELVSAMSAEIRDPRRTLPRAVYVRALEYVTGKPVDSLGFTSAAERYGLEPDEASCEVARQRKLNEHLAELNRVQEAHGAAQKELESVRQELTGVRDEHGKATADRDELQRKMTEHLAELKAGA